MKSQPIAPLSFRVSAVDTQALESRLGRESQRLTIQRQMRAWDGETGDDAYLKYCVGVLERQRLAAQSVLDWEFEQSLQSLPATQRPSRYRARAELANSLACDTARQADLCRQPAERDDLQLRCEMLENRACYLQRKALEAQQQADAARLDQALAHSNPVTRSRALRATAIYFEFEASLARSQLNEHRHHEALDWAQKTRAHLLESQSSAE